jgi:TolA-binding protein
LISASAFAQEAGPIEEASRPLNDGVPQVAVVRLRELLARKLSDADRAAASAKLGEALVAASEYSEAVGVLTAPNVHEIPDAKFPLAQAYAGLSRWSEALPLYQACAGSDSAPVRSDALFGQAEALRALGRNDEALQTFAVLRQDARWSRRAEFRSVELLVAKGDTAGATLLLDAIQPSTQAEKYERRFLRARIAAAMGRNDRAVDLLAPILKNPAGATHPVLIATLFAIADAHLQLRTPGLGDDYLEDFIERQPTDAELTRVFAKLDQLYAAEKKPSRHELGRWSREATEPRRSLSRWYLARAELRLSHRDVALQTFAQLTAEHPRLPALAEGLVEYAQLQFEDRHFEEAAQTLDAARSLSPEPELAERIDLLAGRADYAAQHFEAAAQKFQRVAQSSSALAQTARFDASLAWLQADNPAQFASASQELKKSGADEETRGDLLLEQGLVQAGRGEGQAADSLRNFLRDFPKHSRASEAWVALAELAFHSRPPRLEEARQNLARAAEGQPTPAARERADYLMIWLEEAGPAPNEEKVIALANEFISKHESSLLLPEVRLKLGESYYRRQDFASAQTQFEILAQKNPNSPAAEKAQFFAAQSAMQSMGTAALDHALVLFDSVVKRNGELKWAARNEQAVIERKLGKPQEAMTLYDEVLKGQANPAEQREALCGKGDILYELGAQDRENYRRAIDLYNQLAGQPEASAHWRNQALFKKGMCLEKLEQPAEALATFYQIIEEQVRPDRRREFFWFYKAGFNAARLLEEQSKWQPAAAIYEKLVFAGGSRSEEARGRLNRLRLEHFLWD